MFSLLTMLLLAGTLSPATLMKWQPGLIEQHSYKLAEPGIPGSSDYALRGVMVDGKKMLEVEVLTHRVMSFGAQQGKLESRTITWMDPETFDMQESRLVATMNGAEASYLHARRQGATLSVFQKLRGSPDETRKVDAAGVVIDDNAQNFYIERLPWAAGREFKWQRYNAAQSRLIPNQASLEHADADGITVKITTDLGPTIVKMTGKPPVVATVTINNTEQLKLQDK